MITDILNGHSGSPRAISHLPNGKVESANAFCWRKFCQIAVIMLVLLLPFAAWRYDLIERKGVYATCIDLSYQSKFLGCQPSRVNLEMPYQVWAERMSGTDIANYLGVGLALSQGHGISLKTVTANTTSYQPYYSQGCGTPILIACMLKLFGVSHVFPYFFLVCGLRYLTSLLVVAVAAAYTHRFWPLLIAGVLSLLCLPATNYNFGVGLFSSEPAVEPLFAASMLALQSFWLNTSAKPRFAILCGFRFGGLLALASYFREIYGLFCLFGCGVMILACWRRHGWKPSLMFILATCLTLNLLQLPWKLRNQHEFGEFTMSQTQYYGCALWQSMWLDYKEEAKWCKDCCLGIGNYLRPDASPAILARIDADPKKGSEVAAQAVAREVLRHPVKAFLFKFAGWDTLWLGERAWPQIRLYSLCSLILLATSAFANKHRFLPELYVFPLFIAALSIVIHYEPRYAHPIFLVVTPVATASLLEWLISSSKK